MSLGYKIEILEETHLQQQSSLQEKIKQLTKENLDLIREIEEHKDTKNTFRKQMNELSQKVTDLKVEVSEAHKEKDFIANKLREKERLIRQQEDQILRLEEESKSNERAMSRKLLEIENMKNNSEFIENARSQAQKLMKANEELARAQEELQKVVIQRDNLKDKATQLEAELSKPKQEAPVSVLSSMNQSFKLELENKELRARNEDLQRKLNGKSEEIRALMEENKKARNDLENKAKAAENIWKNQLEEKQNQLDSVKSRLDDVQGKELAKISEEKNVLRNQLDSKNAELKELKLQNSGLMSEINELKRIQIELNQQIENLQSTQSKVMGSAQKDSVYIQKLENKNEELIQRLKTFEQASIAQADALTKAENKIKQLDKEIDSRNTTYLASTQSSLMPGQQLEIELTKKNDEINRLELQITQLTQERNEAISYVQEIEAEMEEQHTLLEEKDRNLKKTAEKLAEARRELQSLGKVTENYKEQVLSLQKEAEESNNRHKAANEKYAEAVTQLKKYYEEKITEVQGLRKKDKAIKEATKLQARVVALEGEIKAKDEEIANLRQEIEDNEQQLQMMAETLKNQVGDYEQRIGELQNEALAKSTEDNFKEFERTVNSQLDELLKIQSAFSGSEKKSFEGMKLTQKFEMIKKTLVELSSTHLSIQRANDQETVQRLAVLGRESRVAKSSLEEMQDKYAVLQKAYRELISLVKESIAVILDIDIMKEKVDVPEPQREDYILTGFQAIESAIYLIAKDNEKLVNELRTMKTAQEKMKKANELEAGAQSQEESKINVLMKEKEHVKKIFCKFLDAMLEK